MPLETQLNTGDPMTADVDLLVLPILQAPLERQKPFSDLDAALDGALSALAKKADFLGKNEQVLELPTLGKLPAARVALLGVGQKRDLNGARLRAFVATAARMASTGNHRSAALLLPDKSGADPLRAAGEGAILGSYRYTKFLTGDRAPKVTLERLQVFKPSGRPSAAEKRAFDLGVQVGEAVCIARDAVNDPPNELYPETLAELCRQIAQRGKLKVKVLDKKGIQQAGMKLHYAVGQGSAHEPRFVHLSYVPKNAKKKLVFVGKGLTFDSGGLCIKPAPGMGEMKNDMGGAAAVIGLMAAVAAVKPNVEVHGIIGAAENMPDGAAYRPGDIFGSLDGKTVEIVNTDAEGRLVLADALTYARQLKPDVIIDAATLTGACVVALGKTYSAYYSADDKLGRRFEAAAGEAGESFWRLPLIEELREQLKSDVADLKHTGERWGGSITAALFLREFVGDVPWIHCDIAGPVMADRARGVVPKGGTGHAALTFLRFVENF